MYKINSGLGALPKSLFLYLQMVVNEKGCASKTATILILDRCA
ncbi:hypothetical protein CLV90_2111 [Maribacter spongiicola]|uniref:Uncharacterized protein n=1 Tax=Maribacter spongiicola TaxID=1206753 RepID=A0A4R7K2G1_9FLAO|nr:hypothetical protein [Maribacter spongiicola]TDT45030.1 hypothetical protein CLV90_2111 [Maribacter spongiicola]